MPDTPLLLARGLKKCYSRKGETITVLDGLDLELRRGEELLITGSSGSGKTTLLNLLSGLEAPSEGEILFDGRSYRELKDREIAPLRATRLGFVFQMHHLLTEFTALENVMLPALIRGENSAAARGRARALLATVGMGHREAHYPAQISGGEAQRVAVARALINQPELVLADEPTGNLDWEIGHQVIDLLRALVRERACAFLLVSHDVRLQTELPTRRLINGRLAAVEEGGE